MATILRDGDPWGFSVVVDADSFTFTWTAGRVGPTTFWRVDVRPPVADRHHEPDLPLRFALPEPQRSPPASGDRPGPPPDGPLPRTGGAAPVAAGVVLLAAGVALRLRQTEHPFG